MNFAKTTSVYCFLIGSVMEAGGKAPSGVRGSNQNLLRFAALCAATIFCKVIRSPAFERK